MKYYVGVEAVGMRRSVGVMADQHHKLISAVRLPFGISLHTTGRDLLRLRLLELLRELTSRAGLTLSHLKDAIVCIGLTGVTFPYDQKIDLPTEVTALDVVRPEQLICTGDAEIVFASHALCEQGTLLLCHMGSTAYVRKGERGFRFGGWGPALGDEGSGYAMGRDALRAIGRGYDRRLQPGNHDAELLWSEVQKWLLQPLASAEPPHDEWTTLSIRWRSQLREFAEGTTAGDAREAIFAFSHTILREHGLSLWRSIASSLTVPLMRAWDAGDEIAGGIAKAAAKSLALQHSDACRIADVPPDFGKTVLYGGVVMHNPRFSKEIQAQLREIHGPGIHFNWLDARSKGTLRPACGALLCAMGPRSDAPRLPPINIIDSIVRQVSDDRWTTELKND